MFAVFVASPESRSSRTSTATTAPISTPLPATDWEQATCQPAAETSPELPAPALSTPQRRKATKVELPRDTDTIILHRKNQPDLRVSVTEEPAVSNPARNPPPAKAAERTHSINLEAFAGKDIQFGVGADVRITMEIE